MNLNFWWLIVIKLLPAIKRLRFLQAIRRHCILSAMRRHCILSAMRRHCILSAMRRHCILSAMRKHRILSAMRRHCILSAIRRHCILSVIFKHWFPFLLETMNLCFCVCKDGLLVLPHTLDSYSSSLFPLLFLQNEEFHGEWSLGSTMNHQDIFPIFALHPMSLSSHPNNCILILVEAKFGLQYEHNLLSVFQNQCVRWSALLSISKEPKYFRYPQIVFRWGHWKSMIEWNWSR